MFYSKGISHLGFFLENNKGDDDNDDTYGDSAVSPSSLHLPSLHHTTQGSTTMNSEEKPWRWGKRKEERNPNGSY